MFLKKHRIFAFFKENIEGFLNYLKSNVIPSDSEVKEPFDICLKRYIELTTDPVFLAKIEELAYLETILIQANCMTKIETSLYLQHNKYSLIYAKSPFPQLNNKYINITVSMGQILNHRKSLNQLSIDDSFMSKTETKILKKMKKGFHYEEYKQKFQ